MKDDRERALRKRALRNMEHLMHGTKEHPLLAVHDTVQVQNQMGNHPSRWDITGTIAEIKDYDQYVVRIHGSGRLTTRNRKFLKKIIPYASDCPGYQNVTPYSDTLASEKSDKDQEQNRDTASEDPPSQDIITGTEDTHIESFSEEEPVLRRSTRVRNAPDRLNIESTKGQSYLCLSRHSCQSVSPLLPSKMPCGGWRHQ